MKDAYLWPDSAETHNSQFKIASHTIAELAAQHGTPLYIFDEATIRSTVLKYQRGLEQYPVKTHIHYASKAFLNTAIAQLMGQLGVGLDVVSLGELAIARHAGADLAKMHMHGNATPRAEMAQAVAWGIGRVVVDNLDQLDMLIGICEAQATQQTILLRIAPDVVAGGNKKIQTGSAESKFGLNIADSSAENAIQRAHASPHLNLVGLHAHTGSQIRSFDALQATIERLFEVADLGAKYGWIMQELSPGGGLAVPINATQTAPLIADYCALVAKTVQHESSKRNWALPAISIEPGRSLIARAAIAVYTVTAHKPLTSATPYIHVDGGIGDNLRPAMYGATYAALNVSRPSAEATQTYQVAGRYCESGDILIPSVQLPPTQVGDLIALPAAGAYTLAMSSNYNGIGRPTVLLLRPDGAHVIQRRETWQDQITRDLPLPK